MITQTKSILNDLTHLLYPEICICCENELLQGFNYLCSFCEIEKLYTDFEKYENPTPMDKLFWGKVDVEKTFALLFFKKKSATQKIAFHLKYKNKPKLGSFLGEEIGNRITEINSYDFECLIPVPLHPKREFLRGYNQSEQIAIGISSVLKIPVDLTSVKRNKNTKSQTKKNRYQRWGNVANKFSVGNDIKTYKHIAIVDDVITTGATIESIINEIKQINPEIKISVLTLAIAS